MIAGVYKWQWVNINPEKQKSRDLERQGSLPHSGRQTLRIGGILLTILSVNLECLAIRDRGIVKKFWGELFSAKPSQDLWDKVTKGSFGK